MPAGEEIKDEKDLLFALDQAPSSPARRKSLLAQQLDALQAQTLLIKLKLLEGEILTADASSSATRAAPKSDLPDVAPSSANSTTKRMPAVLADHSDFYQVLDAGHVALADTVTEEFKILWSEWREKRQRRYESERVFLQETEVVGIQKWHSYAGQVQEPLPSPSPMLLAAGSSSSAADRQVPEQTKLICGLLLRANSLYAEFAVAVLPELIAPALSSSGAADSPSIEKITSQLGATSRDHVVGDVADKKMTTTAAGVVPTGAAAVNSAESCATRSYFDQEMRPRTAEARSFAENRFTNRVKLLSYNLQFRPPLPPSFPEFQEFLSTTAKTTSTVVSTSTEPARRRENENAASTGRAVGAAGRSSTTSSLTSGPPQHSMSSTAFWEGEAAKDERLKRLLAPGEEVPVGAEENGNQNRNDLTHTRTTVSTATGPPGTSSDVFLKTEHQTDGARTCIFGGKFDFLCLQEVYDSYSDRRTKIVQQFLADKKRLVGLKGPQHAGRFHPDERSDDGRGGTNQQDEEFALSRRQHLQNQQQAPAFLPENHPAGRRGPRPASTLMPSTASALLSRSTIVARRRAEILRASHLAAVTHSPQPYDHFGSSTSEAAAQEDEDHHVFPLFEDVDDQDTAARGPTTTSSRSNAINYHTGTAEDDHSSLQEDLHVFASSTLTSNAVLTNGYALDAGLLLLSKYPIVDREELQFETLGRGWDKFICFGALYAKIRIPRLSSAKQDHGTSADEGKNRSYQQEEQQWPCDEVQQQQSTLLSISTTCEYVHLITTRLQPEYDEHSQAARHDQILELVEFVLRLAKKRTGGEQERGSSSTSFFQWPLILTGDFNCRSELEWERDLLPLLQKYLASPRPHEVCTMWETIHDLSSSGSTTNQLERDARAKGYNRKKKNAAGGVAGVGVVGEAGGTTSTGSCCTREAEDIGTSVDNPMQWNKVLFFTPRQSSGVILEKDSREDGFFQEEDTGTGVELQDQAEEAIKKKTSAQEDEVGEEPSTSTPLRCQQELEGLLAKIKAEEPKLAPISLLHKSASWKPQDLAAVAQAEHFVEKTQMLLDRGKQFLKENLPEQITAHASVAPYLMDVEQLKNGNPVLWSDAYGVVKSSPVLGSTAYSPSGVEVKNGGRGAPRGKATGGGGSTPASFSQPAPEATRTNDGKNVTLTKDQRSSTTSAYLGGLDETTDDEEDEFTVNEGAVTFGAALSEQQRQQ
ncbi:unnamed protein product [Amoebophrya sp. A120]|nr:unnamed protein product [Amoebophrya sp. A120]|eukprot:GSA120T00023840001.1